MGTEADPGLVPRICRALAEVQPIDITVSFLEIYNERVHDLLAGESAPPTCHSLPRRRGNARKDLRVREHPDRGPYVQNLRRVAINDVAALLALVSEGSRRRRTAATRRNATSSRSHALLEIATASATLHLADLAGSEKAGWEGCDGRQKEGANINKSLVALSNVISALVSGRGRFVPYRDSALTWLLKDCFTGGASAFIIATVSPSVACYGESASTLRWAERARQLPSPRVTASRPALRTLYTQLLAELSRNHIQYIPETGKISYDDNHWKLYANNVKLQSPDSSEETAKIGNIMNLLHPKADAHSSTASSAASGSSDVINAMDKNIKIDITSEITKEVDKLFGPALERTQSNSDLKVMAPLRHKRRQYKSQEILPIVEKLHGDHTVDVMPSQSEVQIDDIRKIDKAKAPQIPILYDSQRAEIVASVTERLYNKIKKKEEAAASKMETVIDKKIMEPLSELKICTNARQRLMELSQKALRNKRRIGIPAHTQTKKMVTRVRDQGIEVQTDLEAYILRNNKPSYTLHRDAATETMPMTPRCKEIAVGSKYGMLHFHDRSTITDEKKIVHRSSFVMTDVVTKSDRTTQTLIVPPPRRKRRALCNCMKNSEKIKCSNENAAPVISINISQVYPADSESQTSDDNSDNTAENNSCGKSESVQNMPPDLLTNHSTLDPCCSKTVKIEQNAKVYNVNIPQEIEIANDTSTSNSSKSLQNCDDFSDTEDCVLPRVSPDCLKRVDSSDMKDMILGRNENLYPYNIILSPPRAVDSTKRLVKFQDDTVPVSSVASQATCETQNKSTFYETNHNSEAIDNNIDNEANILDSQDTPSNSYSDSIDSSKVETDSFIWKKGGAASDKNKTNTQMGQYTPIYKGAKYAKAKAKLYREFLGLDKEVYDNDSSQTSSKHNDISSSDSVESRDTSNASFRRRKNILEDKLKLRCNHSNSFRSLEQELKISCNSLETSVNKYDSYLSGYHNGKKSGYRTESSARTPTEYLQHLVQLRRQVVNGDCDTESSSLAK
ncbi:kinesin-like protein KIN-5D [Ostrinia furnacalis]|uniref:kinesin-like protein KIN-5D n=1 Tax=Ostrinia furnacalis TaxID=93504 RepID=UPI00103B6B32|nr:kinesin-like protein KIN-5D [Ostrinia furnacalis]